MVEVPHRGATMDETAAPIVVGIKDKQPSALRFAALEARSRRRRLRVVHAFGVPVQAVEHYVEDPALVRQIRTAAQEVLDDVRRQLDELDPTLPVEYVLTERTPLQALEVEAAAAQVLVVGADDVSWLDTLLQTRIVGFLALRAPCPVVVVPEQPVAASRDSEVVVTLDGDTPAAGPLRLAFEEAGARDRMLHVLHATPPGTRADDAAAARANVSEVLAGWRETHPDVTVLERDVQEDPSAAIIDATRRADLVVVGRPHHPHLPMALTRPLAMTVLRRAQCPLVVVPAAYGGPPA
ncbi:MAG: universal stress protein [Actinomycetales bacterium]|nr:MAG: universal stress protein [Actinomycetales bacterium]